MSGSTEAAELAALIHDHPMQIDGGGGLWNAKCLGCGQVASGTGSMLDGMAAGDTHLAAVLLAEGWHRGGEVDAAVVKANAVLHSYGIRGQLWHDLRAALEPAMHVIRATPPAQDGAR